MPNSSVPAARTPPKVSPSEWMLGVPPASRLIFQGSGEARTAAAAAWGVAFADEACRAIVLDKRATLWLGPDEYLLLDFADGPNAAASSIEQALRDLPHSLVDISHRQIALKIFGPHAEHILSGGCPLDLGVAKFPVGMCTRTVFAKADIVLWRTGADTFHLEVWRSFTAYLTGLLQEIASEFQTAPVTLLPR
jgi:sarcosine oxidase, subunit gamma